MIETIVTIASEHPEWIGLIVAIGSISLLWRQNQQLGERLNTVEDRHDFQLEKIRQEQFDFMKLIASKVTGIEPRHINQITDKHPAAPPPRE